MAQPQHGPVRSEVSDLRNIVDRLDLLMGSSAEASADSLGETARQQIHDALSDLTNRVSALEREAEEVRTLVNHLMTIATWQAKVTATLVGEDQSRDVSEGDEEVYSAAGPPDRNFVERVGRHVESRRPEEAHRARRQDEAHLQRSAAPTLDDDIDDILGTDREAPTEDGGSPPDFGI